MSAEALIALIQAILKLAPEVVSLIEGIIGHGNSIPVEQIPTILSQVAELSKDSTANKNTSTITSTASHSSESNAAPSVTT
jgi:hypothetical protein